MGLLNKQRVGGKLEDFLPVRLQPKCAPDPAYCGLRQLRLLCHHARAPVGGVK